MTGDSKESALSRWSRRKLESQQAVEDEAGPVTPADTDAAQAGIEAVEAEAPPPLTDADMPDLDSLTDESDFSPFMSPGVSDELRNLALRKLFHAPVFNIRDGLDEYDDDFTSFEKLGDIVTSDMKHRIEMEEQRLREALAAKDEAEAAQTDAADAVEADVDDDAIEEIDDDEAAESLAAIDSETDSPGSNIETEARHEHG
jgi:hypothetical protein